jgi:hypothetical protein
VAAILETAAVVNDLTGWRESHPFFDPRLITATYGLDPWFSVRGGHNRALEVAAYADRLPREVRERRGKAEFSEVAWASSIRHESTYQRLLSGPLGERGWLDPIGFQDVLEGARNRRPRAAAPVSRALSLDRWLRQVAA